MPETPGSRSRSRVSEAQGARLHPRRGLRGRRLKHGPIALIEDRLPVFCVVPPRGRDSLHDKMVSGIQEVRARGARTIVLAEEGDDDVVAVRRRPFRLPRCRRCCSRWWPWCRCSCSPASSPREGPRRRPAAQPRQVRHRRVSSRCLGVGIDVVDIARFGESLQRTPGLRERLFTDAERERPLASLAARFAAKEALAKALGAPSGMALARRRGGQRAERRARRCSSATWAAGGCRRFRCRVREISTWSWAPNAGSSTTSPMSRKAKCCLPQALIRDKRIETLFLLAASQTRDKDALTMTAWSASSASFAHPLRLDRLR